MIMTQSQAARALGITRQAVHSAMGRLAILPCNLDEMNHDNAPPMFSHDEVERYRAERLTNKGGRPRKVSA